MVNQKRAGRGVKKVSSLRDQAMTVSDDDYDSADYYEDENFNRAERLAASIDKYCTKIS